MFQEVPLYNEFVICFSYIFIIAVILSKLVRMTVIIKK